MVYWKKFAMQQVHVTQNKEELHCCKVKNQTFQRIPTLIPIENTIDATSSKDHFIFS